MAKINENDRRKYSDKIKTYSITADSLLKLEKKLLAEIKQAPNDAPMKRLTLVDEMLNLASNYIAINGISQSVLKIKNLDALNDGRKSLYKSVIYLEEIVSDLLDVPFSEYEEKLIKIETVKASTRFLLARKMGLAIELLENAYGDNTKWKWAFVELEGRYAVVVKNIIDMRNAVANKDPRSPNYEPTMYHLKLVKRLFQQAADRYREKYELSTSRIGDFKMGITFLSALRRFNTLLNEREEAEAAKKKLEIWSTKLENDLRKAEESGSKKV
jgi:hypothetical protein